MGQQPAEYLGKWLSVEIQARGLARLGLRPTSHASLGMGRAGLQPRRTWSQRVAALAAEAPCSLMALAGASGAEAPFYRVPGGGAEAPPFPQNLDAEVDSFTPSSKTLDF